MTRDMLERAKDYFPSHTHLAGVLAGFADKETEHLQMALRELIEAADLVPYHVRLYLSSAHGHAAEIMRKDVRQRMFRLEEALKKATEILDGD